VARRLVSLLLVSSLLGGCASAEVIRAGTIEIPSYEPRPVAVPARCEILIQRTVDTGAGSLSEGEARDLEFCQKQQMVRAQEEEAAARRLDAHASAATFVLRLVAYTVGALIAILTWVF
jgi:hypothetical protein